MATVTPLGIVIGFLPMRDMVLLIQFLIDFRQQLTTDVFPPRGLSTHQPPRCRDNVDAIAAQHARDLMRTDIYAPSGTRNARQICNRRGAARVVTQKNAHNPLYAFALNDEVIDVA